MRRIQTQVKHTLARFSSDCTYYNKRTGGTAYAKFVPWDGSMVIPYMIPIATLCRSIYTDALRLTAPIAILGLGFTG